MGVVIRRKDNGEVFDIPTDFSLEINNTSPIFNDIGSKSIPANFKVNPHNSRMLGYALRSDIANKPTNEIAVIVSEGSYIREGMLYLNEVSNTESTYSVTIAFNEGIMYNKMKSMKLPSLPNLPIDERTQQEMLDYVNGLLVNDDLSSPLTIFPVWLKEQGKYKEKQQMPGGVEWEVEVTVMPFLNEVDDIFADIKTLKIRDKVKYAEGGQPIDVSVPIGYGITPFLRLWYVLELIFSHFGYTIRENPFKTEFQLRRLVMLNNTIDAIVDNSIKYAQLMPNVTVFELFTSLFVRFGAKIFVDGNTNTVDIVLLRDILASSPDTKLPISALPDIQYTEPKQLKLSAGKSLDKSNTETDTYEEFLARYNNTLGFINDLFRWHGVHYYEPHGIFYQAPVGKLSTPEEDGFWGRYRRISSFHFDWNKQTEGIETEEYHSVDEGLTMYGDNGEYLFYGIDYALRNSKLEINQNISSVETENKLAFAFDMGLGYNWWAEKKSWGYKFGTILPYLTGTDLNEELVYIEDKEGNTMKYALTFIGKNGCFEHFHKQHDAMLRHSNYVVKTKIDMPKFQLTNLKYQEIFNLHSQPMLIDKLNYIVGDFNSKELTARTTRLYQPYDLEKEHGHPKPDRIKYQWKLQNAYEEALISQFNYWEDHYKKNPPLPNLTFYQFKSLEYEVVERPNPPSDLNLWYLPPTDKQFERQTIIGLNKHIDKVKYTLKYSHYVSDKIEQAAYSFNKPLNYESFFIPKDAWDKN